MGRHLRIMLAMVLLVGSTMLTGVASTFAYYIEGGLNITNDSAPQNYADIDGTVVVWRDGREGTCGAWDIWMYDFATGVQRPVTTADKKQEFPRIDGNRVVYQSDQDCESWPNDTNIYVYDLIQDDYLAIAVRTSDQEHPDISGDIVAWSEYDYDDTSTDWDIFAYDLSTGVETEVCAEQNWQGDVRVDGDRIVWVDNRNGSDADIYMYDLSEGLESEVCTDSAEQWDAVIEGDTIAWIDYRDGYDAIWTYDIPTGMSSEVATSTSSMSDLEIGDGRLVWSDSATGDGDVYMYDMASQTVTQVTSVDECDGMPAISGDMVVYNHYMPGPGQPDIWAISVADEAELPVSFTTVAGATRYETAVQVSENSYPTGADTVIIATGSNWPDALGASALAGAYRAPILLSTCDALPAAVAAEITRLGATDAFIIGGTGALSSDVEDAVAGLVSGSVTRLGGVNRYETAELVAAETVNANSDWDGTAFVTTGLNFPDALSASPLAAYAGWPIFLSGPDGITAETQAAMDALGVTRLLLLGGTGVVPASVSIQADSVGVMEVERISGMTRYGTAVAVATYGADQLGMGWASPALATGENFPDALAAGAAQGLTGGLLLLTPPDELDPTTASAIAAHRFQMWSVKYVGGTGAVSAGVRAQVESLLP